MGEKSSWLNRAAIILPANGSELHLALWAAKDLGNKSIKCRVISVPCVEAFEAQDSDYQRTIFPKTGVPIAAIEAAQPDLWHKWLGKNALTIGLHRFGASAPDKVIAEELGFTVPKITEKLETWLQELQQ